MSQIGFHMGIGEIVDSEALVFGCHGCEMAISKEFMGQVVEYGISEFIYVQLIAIFGKQKASIIFQASLLAETASPSLSHEVDSLKITTTARPYLLFFFFFFFFATLPPHFRTTRRKLNLSPFTLPSWSIALKAFPLLMRKPCGLKQENAISS